MQKEMGVDEVVDDDHEAILGFVPEGVGWKMKELVLVKLGLLVDECTKKV